MKVGIEKLNRRARAAVYKSEAITGQKFKSIEMDEYGAITLEFTGELTEEQAGSITSQFIYVKVPNATPCTGNWVEYKKETNTSSIEVDIINFTNCLLKMEQIKNPITKILEWSDEIFDKAPCKNETGAGSVIGYVEDGPTYIYAKKSGIYNNWEQYGFVKTSPYNIEQVMLRIAEIAIKQGIYVDYGKDGENEDKAEFRLYQL